MPVPSIMLFAICVITLTIDLESYVSFVTSKMSINGHYLGNIVTLVHLHHDLDI